MGRLRAHFTKVRRSRMDQLRADLEMVWRGVSGRNPAPYEDRRGRTSARWASLPPSQTHAAVTQPDAVLGGTAYVVERRVEETTDAVSLWLRCAGGAMPPAKPGQFYTVRVPHPGGALKRAYSASHDCRDTTRLRLTIQRVEDGRASTFLTEQVREGSRLQLLGPSGSFGDALADGKVRRVVMIAGGSGVTPMAALCHSLLGADREGLELVLIHGVRSPQHALLADELTALAEMSRGRLALHHIYERDSPAGQPVEGRLTPEVLTVALDAALASLSAPAERYLVCGPAGMLDSARATLRERGIPAAQIEEERFASPEPQEGANATTGSARLTFLAGSRSLQVEASTSETILSRGLEAGVRMPYSCTMGGCGACRVKLLEGEVSMESPNCLTGQERNAGEVLACVSRATGPCVIEVPQ